MSTATRLGLYNAALALLKERELSALTDSVETRRVLDNVWNRGRGIVHACLEQGLWNFATRTSSFDTSASITVSFGFPYGFEQPSDFVRLVGIASDEFFTHPLSDAEFTDEAGNWYANSTPIYVRYVSNGTSYGNNLSLWPESFTRYVECYLAVEAAPRLTKSKELTDDLYKLIKNRLLDAKSKDAMNEGTGILPEGSWNRARRGGRSSWRDRGYRHTLIG